VEGERGLLTTERGRDPRNLDILAFGGAGPIHAAELARQLGVKRVLIPPLPGVFSSFGLLLADLRFDFLRSVMRRSVEVDDVALASEFADLAADAQRYVEDLDLTLNDAELEWALDMRYEGQSSDLSVVVPPDTSAAAVFEAFAAEHEATYGHRATGEVVLVVNCRLRVLLRGRGNGDDYRSMVDRIARTGSGAASVGRSRKVYFGEAHGWLETPLIDRAELSASPRRGPAIVTEHDTTVVVPPEFSAAKDEMFNIVLTREEGS